MEIVFRLPIVDDYNFLLSSWLKSARIQHHEVEDKIYFEAYKARVRMMLATRDTMLAVDPDDPLLILGYINYDDSAVHFLYVKHALRNFGIATQLLSQTNKSFPITVTESSKVLKHYRTKYPGRIVYNPYIV